MCAQELRRRVHAERLLAKISLTALRLDGAQQKNLGSYSLGQKNRQRRRKKERGGGLKMEKEMRFQDEVGRYINWNSIIPPMLDVWFKVLVTKDIDTGEIVIRIVEGD